MRIAWYSPLQHDLALKTSAYSRAIVPLLPEHFDIEFFVDSAALSKQSDTTIDNAQVTLAQRRYPVWHYHRLYEREKKKPFSFCVYQLEDHLSCRYIERQLHCLPGICFFHDLNLNRLHLSRFNHSTAGSDINEFMDREFGRQAPRLGDWRLRNWPTEVLDIFFPSGRNEISAATVAVTLNADLRKELKSRAATPVVSVRPAVDTVVSGYQRSRAMSHLKESDFVLVVFGEQVLAHRVVPVLDAIAHLSEATLDSGRDLRVLWIVEDQYSEEVVRMHLDARINSFKSSVAFVQSSDVSRTVGAIDAADLCVAVSNSSLRTLPPGVLVAMNLAKAIVVSDTQETKLLSNSVVWKIALGLSEQEQLRQALQVLFAEDTRRDVLGRAAKEFAEREFNPRHAARDCEIVFQQYGDVARLAKEDAMRRYREKKTLLVSEGAEALRQTGIQMAVNGQSLTLGAVSTKPLSTLFFEDSDRYDI